MPPMEQIGNNFEKCDAGLAIVAEQHTNWGWDP